MRKKVQRFRCSWKVNKKNILQKWCRVTDRNWLWMWTRHWNFGLTKTRIISWLLEQLLASQEATGESVCKPTKLIVVLGIWQRLSVSSRLLLKTASWQCIIVCTGMNPVYKKRILCTWMWLFQGAKQAQVTSKETYESCDRMKIRFFGQEKSILSEIFHELLSYCVWWWWC